MTHSTESINAYVNNWTLRLTNVSKLRFGAIILLAVLFLLGVIFALGGPKNPKPVHQHAQYAPISNFTFEDNRAQKFNVPISTAIRLHIEISPFIYSDKIAYSTKVELQCWNSNGDSGNYQSDCRYEPKELMEEINKITVYATTLKQE